MTWTDVLAIIALVISICAVWYNRRQATEARRQSEVAEQQLELAKQMHREQAQPYLVTEIDKSTRESDLLVLRVTNAGASAARHVRVSIDPPLQKGRDHWIAEQRVLVLAPGGVWELGIAPMQWYLKQDYPREYKISVEGEGPFGSIDQEVYPVNLNWLSPKSSVDSDGVLIAGKLEDIRIGIDKLRATRLAE